MKLSLSIETTTTSDWKKKRVLDGENRLIDESICYFSNDVSSSCLVLEESDFTEIFASFVLENFLRSLIR